MISPIDYRDANFEAIQARIHGDRRAVLDAWLAHGPGTTREVAQRSGIDLLTLRPRTTELVQLGFVVVDEGNPAELSPHKREGRYRALGKFEAVEIFQSRQRAARAAQTELALDVGVRSQGSGVRGQGSGVSSD